ncbi:MAG: purine-cytosine permease family protein [Chloroflexota bacterium]
MSAEATPLSAEEAEHRLFERRGRQPVPVDIRYGSAASQFRVWFGANAVVSSLFVGFLGPVAFGLSFWATLSAIAVGTIIAALGLGFASTFGPRTGMVQILFSRFTFGYTVGRIIGFFNALYTYSWSAVNLVTGVAAVQLAFLLLGLSALGPGKGSYTLWIIVIAAITTTVSVIGYNLVLHWEKWSTYLTILIFAIITIAVLSHHPNAGASSTSGGAFWKNWLGMVLTSFGFGIGWITYVSDYSRKLPSTISLPAVFVSSFLGLTLSAVWVESLGALLTTTAFKVTAATNVVHGVPAVLGNNGWVVAGVLIIGLSTVSNNIPNDYTGGLSVQAAGLHVPRWAVTLAGGALSAIAAILFLQNFADKFQAFLLLLSYWVGAWFVLILYNFFKRGGHYDPRDWDRRSSLPAGFGPTIALLAALVAAWFGMYPLPQVDWGKLGQGLLGTSVGVDLGFIAAIVTALVIRTLLDLVLPDRMQHLRESE